jgi:hypothetical protein
MLNEIGLVSRVRLLGLSNEEADRFYTACSAFILRDKTSNHLRACLPDRARGPAIPVIEWMVHTYYPLISLKQALWLACKGKRVSHVAWKTKTLRRDVQKLLDNCPEVLRRKYKRKIYWPETPVQIENELVRLATSTVRREVYQHLAFIGRSDTGVGPDDLVQELHGELAKVIRLYDFAPTVKVDELRRGVMPWQSQISFKLSAQPVRLVRSVLVDGKKVTDWTISKDRITIQIPPSKSRRSVTVRVLFWHHLRALNYSRMAIQRRAHRLVEYHTALCRRRMDSVKAEDGSYSYSHTQVSLHTPTGEDESSRTLEEHLPDPNSSNREAQSVVEVAIEQILNRVSNPAAVRFARITMAEELPLDFKRWCMARNASPSKMSSADLAALAMEFVGISSRDLDELRSMCIQEGLIRATAT